MFSCWSLNNISLLRLIVLSSRSGPYGSFSRTPQMDNTKSLYPGIIFELDSIFTSFGTCFEVADLERKISGTIDVSGSTCNGIDAVLPFKSSSTMYESAVSNAPFLRLTRIDPVLVPTTDTLDDITEFLVKVLV